MDWKKWSGKAAQYAADGAVEKTAEFALTKIGPFRVADIIAKLLMAGAIVFALGGWLLHFFAGYAGVASAVYVIAAGVFTLGFLISMVRSFILDRARRALKTGVDWTAGEVKRRYSGDGANASGSGNPPVADAKQVGNK